MEPTLERLGSRSYLFWATRTREPLRTRCPRNLFPSRPPTTRLKSGLLAPQGRTVPKPSFTRGLIRRDTTHTTQPPWFRGPQLCIPRDQLEAQDTHRRRQHQVMLYHVLHICSPLEPSTYIHRGSKSRSLPASANRVHALVLPVGSLLARRWHVITQSRPCNLAVKNTVGSPWRLGVRNHQPLWYYDRVVTYCHARVIAELFIGFT
ncbi:hypothetical protein F4802DRAFT_358106 [Xylaria palmicola]|nr:hypothetical protein F4802DRAFT_358106 [Xylaria palmicola]